VAKIVLTHTLKPRRDCQKKARNLPAPSCVVDSRPLPKNHKQLFPKENLSAAYGYHVRPPRILITRSPHQASALAERLRALGADPILIPTIELADPTSFAPLDTALTHLDRFHWLLFTSANAVETFHRRLLFFSILYPLSSIPCRIAAIGPATAQALKAIGLPPNLIPPQAIAESFATALLPHARQPDGSPSRFLLIRAEEARNHLPETLQAAGAQVTIAPAYRTIIPLASIDAIRNLFSHPETIPDAITFTSSSTAHNLFTLLEAAGITLPPKLVILREAEDLLHLGASPPPPPILASIGPITSATLRDLGYPPQVEATEANITSLAENLVKYLHSKKSA
jgi:uroporphyrinogen-III synthase